MSVVRIDPSKVLRPVPPIRGAMTEWMNARPGPAKGTERGYGQMLALEEEDIALAARTGLNTIRCAVEHHALEEVERPGVYKEDGFARVDADAGLVRPVRHRGHPGPAQRHRAATAAATRGCGSTRNSRTAS